MSYLTLSEAAQYATNKTGQQIEPASLLRAGVLGTLLIAAPFSGQMRNLVAHRNDEVLGLLIVPRQHLFEIEAKGQATIKGAYSLDGKTAYSPQTITTRDELRVQVSELDGFIRSLVEIKHQPQTAPAGTPDNNEPSKVRRDAKEFATTKQIAEAFPHPKGTKPENWKKTLSDPPAWLKDARLFSGGPGVSALWNPATFALCMVSEGHISKQSALNIIRREFPDFLDEWEDKASHL